jgi:hypothetical protein
MLLPDATRNGKPGNADEFRTLCDDQRAAYGTLVPQVIRRSKKRYVLSH